MAPLKREDRVLRTALVLKALGGALDIVAGILLALTSRRELGHAIFVLTRQELNEDPRDFVATHLRELALHVTSDMKLFAVAYLLVHGAVTIALALSLLRRRAWAYPWALAFFAALLAYEAYRLVLTHSAVMAGLVCLDLVIVALLVRERNLYSAMERAAPPDEAR